MGTPSYLLRSEKTWVRPISLRSVRCTIQIFQRSLLSLLQKKRSGSLTKTVKPEKDASNKGNNKGETTFPSDTIFPLSILNWPVSKLVVYFSSYESRELCYQALLLEQGFRTPMDQYRLHDEPLGGSHQNSSRVVGATHIITRKKVAIKVLCKTKNRQNDPLDIFDMRELTLRNRL